MRDGRASSARGPSKRCRNCETALAGPYCHACGQRAGPADPTLGELLAEAVQEALSVDGKVLATVRALLLRPGRLTTDFLAGRRVRYVSPLRIYLACSLSFFGMLALQPPPSSVPRAGTFRLFGGTLALAVDVHAHPDDRSPLGKVRGKLATEVLASPERHARLERTASDALPRAVFLLVPAYAAAIQLAYWRGGRRYPQHLCFALHAHAFLFAVLALLAGVRAALYEAARAVNTIGAVHAANLAIVSAGALTAVVLPVYLLLAHRRVYRVGWAGTVIRVAMTTVAHVIAIGIALIGLVVLTIVRA